MLLLLNEIYTFFGNVKDVWQHDIILLVGRALFPDMLYLLLNNFRSGCVYLLRS